MPITNQAPLVQISPSNTNTCLTQEGADVGCSGANDLVPTLRPSGKVTYFRIATTDSHQGPAGADYLYKTKNYKSVYVIDDATTYGVGIADAFSKEWTAIGGKLLGRSSEASTTTSYLSLLTQIATMHPDVIYFGGLDSTGGILIRQQMEQVPALKNEPFAGGDGIVTSTFSKTIGTSGGGPIFGTVATVDEGAVSTAQTFLNQYDAVYGAANLGAYSAAGYDAANILIQAIKTALANGAHTPQNSSDTAGAKSFRQAVINAVQNINFSGVLGHQSFDQNGDTTNRVITIYQVGANPPNKPVGTPGWNPVSAVTV
jgi:branched-chain amino acid transport system substrate-binding protein